MKPPIRKYKRLQTLLIRLVVILLLTFAVTGGMTLHPLAATAEGSPPNQGETDEVECTRHELWPLQGHD